MTRLLSTGRIRCYVMYGDHTCCSRPISGAPVWTGKHPTSAGLYGTIFRPAEPVAAVRPVWWRAPSVLRKEAPSAGASRRALSVLYGCARPPPPPPPSRTHDGLRSAWSPTVLGWWTWSRPLSRYSLCPEHRVRMEADASTPAVGPPPAPSRLRRLLRRLPPTPAAASDPAAAAAGRHRGGGAGGGGGGDSGSDSGGNGSDGSSSGSGAAPSGDVKSAATAAATEGARLACGGDEADDCGGPPPLPPVSFLALFRYATPVDKALLVAGTVAAVGHGAMLPIFALLFGDLIDAGNSTDTLSPTAALDATATAAWKLLLLGGVSGALSFLQVTCWMTSSQRQAVRMRTLFTASLLRQEMGYYDGLSSGTLTAHVTGDVAVIQAGMGDKIATIIQQASTAIAGFAIAFVGSWKLTLVVLSTAPALAVVGGLFGKFAAEATVRGQKSYAAAGAVAEEALTLFRTVVAYGGEATEAAKYERLLLRAARDEERRSHLMGISIGISMFIMLSVYGLSFWYGGKLVRDGDVTSGAVVTVFFAIIIGAMGLGQTAPGISAVHAARGAAPRVFEVIERTSAIDPLDDAAGVVPPAVDGRLALRDVGFAYPSHPDRQVLTGTSVAVGKGQTLALVGASGCGKVQLDDSSPGSRSHRALALPDSFLFSVCLCRGHWVLVGVLYLITPGCGRRCGVDA